MNRRISEVIFIFQLRYTNYLFGKFIGSGISWDNKFQNIRKMY